MNIRPSDMQLVDYASLGSGGNVSSSGTAFARLLNSGMDLNALRPYVGKDGNTYTTELVGYKDGKPVYRPRLVTNAPSTFLKDEWKQMDTAVQEVYRSELGAWQEVMGRNLRYNIPDGLGVTMLQGQTRSDIGDATMSMDGLRRGENDRHLYEIHNLPLPLIHKDFVIPMRDLAVSRRKGLGMDVELAQDATRKVLEIAEKLLIGSYVYPTVGGATIYGMTTYNNRITGSVTAPTTSGWTPDTLVSEVLTGRQTLINNYQRGPIMMFMGTGWMKFLDGDYSAAKGSNTLRQRVLAIEGIQGIRTLDFLSGYRVVMVIMNPRNVRIVTFAPLRVVRWEEMGGMEMHMKVMMGAVPQFRADYNNRCGVLDLATA